MEREWKRKRDREGREGEGGREILLLCECRYYVFKKLTVYLMCVVNKTNIFVYSYIIILTSLTVFP